MNQFSIGTNIIMNIIKLVVFVTPNTAKQETVEMGQLAKKNHIRVR